MKSSESLNLKQISTQAIVVGSKSFSLAGFILSPEIRDDAFNLYNWCRHCDDAIDESPETEQLAKLQALKKLTHAAMTGTEPLKDPAFLAFQMVYQKHQWPTHYPEELLMGMEMDVTHQSYETLDDLLLYCYRVAGVVGLMMAHILGVSNEKALRHACDLGLAMQLTNIARDVFTDFRKGRIYLPLQWLREMNVDGKNLPNHPIEVFQMVEKILNRADTLYRSGEQGIPYLSFRSAVAIQSARNIYAEIGNMVRHSKDKAWDQRIYTSKFRKIALVGKSFFQVLIKKLSKWGPRWQAVPIKSVWRLQ